MSTSLLYSDYTKVTDPHRCGNSPFVPRVDSETQNSCGSYEAGFNKNGCNKYRPNYPDDMYIEKHGCRGLADCKDGVPPTGDMVKEGWRIREGPPTKLASQYFWPIDGHGVAENIGASCRSGCVENFDMSGPKHDTMTNLFYIALVVGIVWFTTKR